jgi:TrmH family RNA methyltransferase
MKIQPITSRSNPEVRRARRLEEDRSFRDRSDLYIAWGTHLAQEALRAGVGAERVFLGPRIDATGEGKAIRERLARAGAPILPVTTAVLESIVPGSGDQGILIVLPRPDTGLESAAPDRPEGARLPAGSGATGAPPLWLAAHGVQDPGNLGGLVRSAAALGASAIALLEGCADPFSSRAVRAAMGAHFRVRIALATASAWIGLMEESGIALVAAASNAGVPPAAVDLRGPTALVVGSEGTGLPASILAAAARRVRIPMAAGTESLNVHASAAILLYEVARQRRSPDPGPADRRG